MSPSRLNCAALFVLTLFFAGFVHADEPGIESFSPTGTVKDVRQVVVRFDTPMVPFGDPRLAEPFDIQCPVPGKSRWADARNWIYDFESDLPGGVVCNFRLKSDVTTLAGESLAGEKAFSFDTGVLPDGRPDVGLLFAAYAADLSTQFLPIQQRLAE